MTYVATPPAMAVAPHALAAHTGRGILRDGGNAIEAVVGMAATLAVVYPHMSGIGGDGFWLLSAPDAPVVAIDGAGNASADASPAFYGARGVGIVPVRGPLAANTLAGTLAGWKAALDWSVRYWGGAMPLGRLLEESIHYAEAGFPVTRSQSRATASKLDELRDQPGFAAVYLDGASAPAAGSVLRLPALAETLRRLRVSGLDAFYRGALGRQVAAELAGAGSPVRLRDLQGYKAVVRAPLALRLGGRLPGGELYGLPPPSQGLATLLIVGQYAYGDGMVSESQDPADYLHCLVEATKVAFAERNRLVSDPADIVAIESLLSPGALRGLSRGTDPQRAAPWRGNDPRGDTTWFGAVDAAGRAVSCIQSLFFEFGCGLVLEETGICWQNRGSSFSLEPGDPRCLAPGRKPFHTLCPSLARLADGRTLVFGTMGGEGQPQTQAALLTRYLVDRQTLAAAIDAPRWLLGRAWGGGSDGLKLENRFAPEIPVELSRRGHQVESVEGYDEMMGHAGAIVRFPDGYLEGAADPRGDGAALCARRTRM